MNLQEEEILKLASLGNHGNLENAVDVLKRSLALRNRYTPLSFAYLETCYSCIVCILVLFPKHYLTEQWELFSLHPLQKLLQ